jgi:hypothetical protein
LLHGVKPKPEFRALYDDADGLTESRKNYLGKWFHEHLFSNDAILDIMQVL